MDHAFNLAADRIKQQIKHYKEKLQDHRRNPSHNGGDDGLNPAREPPGPDPPPRRGDTCMRLTNFLVRDAIIPRLSGHGRRRQPARPDRRPAPSRSKSIGEMVAALRRPGTSATTDLADIVRAVLRRERTRHHRHRPGHRHPALAAPVRGPADRHARDRRDGLPFDSLDGEPVYVFVLLVSPQDQPGRPPAGAGGRRADDAGRGLRPPPAGLPDGR